MNHVDARTLNWRDTPMPDSSGPVQLARLPDRDDGGFRALVRFPPGWRRDIAGHYNVSEEILILEGALSIDAVTARVGDWLWIAACEVRTVTSAPDGCLAFACFGGVPQWVRGDA